MGSELTDQEWIDALNLAEAKSNKRLLEDLEILADREKKFLEHPGIDEESREIIVYNLATFASTIARIKMYLKIMESIESK